ATALHPRESRFRATATLGDRAWAHAPVRAVRVGAIDVGAESSEMMIPAFARNVVLCRAPQGALAIRFLDATGAELSEAAVVEGEEVSSLVVPGAQRFAISNRAPVPVANVRAVFGLAL